MSFLLMKANHLPKVRSLALFLIMLLNLIGCERPLSAEEKREKASESIGILASFAAVALASAVRSCQIVGVSDIDQCTKIKGTLLADRSAQTMASFAVEQRLGYWKACQADFSNEYCGQLIRRAVEIELRKPIKPGE
jgi:hypothetical protein